MKPMKPAKIAISQKMEAANSDIPMPKYIQWTTETALPGCLGLVFGFVGIIGMTVYLHPMRLSFIQEMEVSIGFTFLGGLLALYVPLVIITLINVGIRFRWYLRIGRRKSWKAIRGIPAHQRNQYEILVRRLFTGFMSFGTYNTVGGWDAFLLRDKEN